MSNLEWGVPHLLTTPKGVLPFNEPIGTSDLGVLLLDEQKCSAAPALRVVTDDVPQADGSILHDKFKTGYAVRLCFQMWTDAGTNGAPACGAQLRELWDYLMLRLNSLLRPDAALLATGQARLQWTPSGYSDDRMWDRVEMFEWPTPTYEGGGIVSAVFGLQTPMPHAIDLTQVTTAIAEGATVRITNPGSAPTYPVFRVHGDVSAFDITNTTTGQKIGYDAANPGGAGIASGHYLEIDSFGGTAILDGNSTPLPGGVDADTSEFFALDTGPNDILYTGDGGTLDVLWNPAWA